MIKLKVGETSRDRFYNNIDYIKKKLLDGDTKQSVYNSLHINKKTFNKYINIEEIKWTDWRDLRGKRFGRLTVLERNGSTKSRSIAWDCMCECGEKKRKVSSAHLRNGAVASCGCLLVENSIKVGIAQVRDLSGKKFGKLTAIRYLKQDERSIERSSTGAAWLCRCDCGEEIETLSKVLLKNEIKSCGCSNASLGEMEIAKTLDDNNINYIPEMSFVDLRSDAGGVPRYDFYLPEDNIVIEFQGKQHYQETSFFGEKNSLANNEKRDKLKRDYANSKGIGYIEIHYSNLGNIDIMGRIKELT